jgi:bifunctional DNA-binding transcriptional regulator/antitoxin component of YhaV-PrlF toxin-antitoxin module
MTLSTIIQIRGKGSVTLPVELRRKYRFNEGDVLRLIDLGDGSFLITPQDTTIDRLGDRVAELMAEQDITLDEILETLDQERQQYYQEHYARD